MCSPELEVKLSKVATIFADDGEEDEEKPRERLKVMNFITGSRAVNDARYELKATP